MKTMNQKELFCFINQVSFMLDDITLFLNTHPNCMEAIEAYNHYKEMRKEADIRIIGRVITNATYTI